MFSVLPYECGRGPHNSPSGGSSQEALCPQHLKYLAAPTRWMIHKSTGCNCLIGEEFLLVPAVLFQLHMELFLDLLMHITSQDQQASLAFCCRQGSPAKYIFIHFSHIYIHSKRTKCRSQGPAWEMQACTCEAWLCAHALWAVGELFEVQEQEWNLVSLGSRVCSLYSCTSEGEEAITNSYFSSQLMPQDHSQDKCNIHYVHHSTCIHLSLSCCSPWFCFPQTLWLLLPYVSLSFSWLPGYLAARVPLCVFHNHVPYERRYHWINWSHCSQSGKLLLAWIFSAEPVTGHWVLTTQMKDGYSWLSYRFSGLFLCNLKNSASHKVVTQQNVVEWVNSNLEWRIHSVHFIQ